MYAFANFPLSSLMSVEAKARSFPAWYALSVILFLTQVRSEGEKAES